MTAGCPAVWRKDVFRGSGILSQLTKVIRYGIYIKYHRDHPKCKAYTANFTDQHGVCMQYNLYITALYCRLAEFIPKIIIITHTFLS